MMQIQTIGAARTMSSREIAGLVEARHNDVVATIERLFSKGLLRSSRETRRESTGGRPLDVYDQIGGTWTPYAEHLDAGRFVVKTGSADNGHAFSAARFTPKGVAWVSALWSEATGGAK